MRIEEVVERKSGRICRGGVTEGGCIVDCVTRIGLAVDIVRVAVSAAVIVAVTDPTGGANGCGAGSGRGPGSGGAGTAVSGLTKRLSVATFFARSSDF